MFILQEWYYSQLVVLRKDRVPHVCQEQAHPYLTLVLCARHICFYLNLISSIKKYILTIHATYFLPYRLYYSRIGVYNINCQEGYIIGSLDYKYVCAAPKSSTLLSPVHQRILFP